MKGKIALEEGWALPESLPLWDYASLAPKGVWGNDVLSAVQDVHGTRLTQMDENGIDLMVLHVSAPGCQGVADPAGAAALATLANDRLAAEVLRAPHRFAAWASVSMHDPAQAAAELRRVFGAAASGSGSSGSGSSGSGFVGVLLNDFQSAGADQNTMLFYDGPEYDVFWRAAEELDAPVYIHPRDATPLIQDQMWKGRPWLRLSAWGYADRVGMHVLGIVTNGVLDRFPKLKIIFGHMGEHM